MQITSKDVGRKVNLRNGDTATIIGWNTHTNYTVHGIHRDQGILWTHEGYFNLPTGGKVDDMYDIVSFVEEPAKAQFIITEKDCQAKRRVKLRNGSEVKLEMYLESDRQPIVGHIIGDEDGSDDCWCSNGKYQIAANGSTHLDTQYDIVSFVEDTPAFKITEADIKAERKVKLRNGTTVTLRGLLDPNFPFPVAATSSEGYTLHWNTRGHFDTSGNAERDMIAFVEDPLPLTLTINDVLSHRKVLLRDGRKATLFAWNDSSLNCYSVDGVIEGETQRRSWTIGGKTFYKSTNADDIVGFVEEPAFIITEADCKAKRTVKLRCGIIAVLTQFRGHEYAWPVEGQVPNVLHNVGWKTNGAVGNELGCANDIVGFVEEAPKHKQIRDLTVEEIGALVGTHNFKLVHNPALIRTIWHNMKHIWEKNNQADILIAPVGTEDWKPMQKEC